MVMSVIKLWSDCWKLCRWVVLLRLGVVNYEYGGDSGHDPDDGGDNGHGLDDPDDGGDDDDEE